MSTGVDLFFSNVETFFRFMITVEYFRTVILFAFFLAVLYLLRKFMKTN